MEVENIIIALVLALGSVQGVIYGAVLFRSTQRNKIANRLLAVMLFLLSYRLFVQIMRLFGIGYYDVWYYFMLDLSWVYGCLLYFYVKAQTQPGFSLSRKSWVHFMPVLVQVVFSIFVRLQNLYWDGTKESLSWLGYYGYMIWMNNATIYIVACSLIIWYAFKSQKLLNNLDDEYELDTNKLGWLKLIVKSFLIYFSLVLVILLVDLLVFSSSNSGSYFYFTRFYYYPFFIGISILTYWIGIAGFSRRNDQEVLRRAKPQPEEVERLKRISEKLSLLMKEEKLFKIQDLSLSLVANKLEVKPYLISKSLAVIDCKRFNDYINEFRIAEVRKLLRKPDHSKFTLLGLAMDAGFNSKSSFHRAVKKHLGISPSELKALE